MNIKIWIQLQIAAVLLMIIIGGATRITHSGLSMAEWKPLNILPPITTQAWEKEFNIYKKTPEYLHVNKGMGLNEFKNIYWWEYGHRSLGKLFIILIFTPLLFSYKSFPTWLKKYSISIFMLGITQGIIGWLMVKSGLKKNPSVCHFHLCLHLLMALIILSILSISLWKLEKKTFKKILLRDFIFLGLITTTIIYGASVAGLKAGLIYNSFPFMGNQLIPNEWLHQSPLWTNFANNPVTIQWTHRFLALITLSYAVFLRIKFGYLYKNLIFIIGLQVLLGITTLLLHVPLICALAHQFLAIIVWIVSLKAACINLEKINST